MNPAPASMASLYRRALAGALRGPSRRPNQLRDVELAWTGVRVDRDHLRRYQRVCQFRLTEALPPTYPHVLAFPLALALMTRGDFPLPLLGLVHLANTIEQARPLTADEVFDLSVRAENLREHDRGRAVDLLAVATVEGTEVWRGRSVYLRKERRSMVRAGGEHPAPPAAAAVWSVGAEVGRAYALVSGDRNPIHTSRLAAKAFGFPRRIAHGLWSKARCLAALEGRLPDQLTVDVTFGRPVLLPSTVAFSTEPGPDDWRFGLYEPATGRPHVLGTIARGQATYPLVGLPG
ncbi:MAG: MaoC family dehydratase [Micromonosporaceae bacterium]